MPQRVKSAPCIGFCSTTYGDPICRGCYRSLSQVLEWSRLTAEDKQDFYDKIALLAEKHLAKLISITEPALVQEWAATLSLYCQRSLYYDLLQALQQGVNIASKSPPGSMTLLKNLSLSELYRQVDSSIYRELCE